MCFLSPRLNVLQSVLVHVCVQVNLRYTCICGLRISKILRSAITSFLHIDFNDYLDIGILVKASAS
jgi:hypothetical protein